jgi:glycosyltransferase involved in cell wall biosynthesis
MKLSIVIPNYNSEKTLAKTLDSIFAQKLSDYEVLLIDDCSTDKSLMLLKKYPKIRVIKNIHNRGPAYTRNQGIKNAVGEYLIFIDSDVYLKGNGINEILKKSKSHDITFPKIVYENNLSMYPNSKGDEEYLMMSPIFCISKNAVNKLNNSYFDENYTGYCEDADFFLKCYLQGLSCKYIPSALAVHKSVKPKYREERYYSEIAGSLYGAIKYFGLGEINKFDHAFKISNLFKLYLLGIFNFKLFDAQLNNFDKTAGALYKLKYMLMNKNKITEKGRIFLFFLTCKGIGNTLKNYKKPLEERKKLLLLIQKNKQKGN